MHRSEEQAHLEAALAQKPWRIPDAPRCTRDYGISVQHIFNRLADPSTSEHEARGLIQSVVLAAGEDANKGSDAGKDARRTIVAALTDIGRAPTPEEHGMLADLAEVCRTARVTLAKHVAPHICERNAYNDGVERLETLTDLVRFYKNLAERSVQVYFREEHSGKELANVRNMLERVFLGLRSALSAAPHIVPGSGDLATGGVVKTALDDLTTLFVRLRWWESLGCVRAVGAIPLLYEHEEAGDRTSANFVPLQYPWEHVETLRLTGALSSRSTLEEQRDTILHDVAAILAASGGRFGPQEHEGRMSFSGITSLRGLFPLLHDLVATFVREVELACPGVLSDDIPLPEQQTCLQHDECFNEAVRKGRAERAMQVRVQRKVHMMRFDNTFIYWTASATEHRDPCENRVALLKHGTCYSLVDTPERKRQHLRDLSRVLDARERGTAWKRCTQPEKEADDMRTVTVLGRENAAYADWATICFASEISIEHYRAQVAAALDAIK